MIIEFIWEKFPRLAGITINHVTFYSVCNFCAIKQYGVSTWHICVCFNQHNWPFIDSTSVARRVTDVGSFCDEKKCFFDKLQCQKAKCLLSEVKKSETKVIAPKKEEFFRFCKAPVHAAAPSLSAILNMKRCALRMCEKRSISPAGRENFSCGKIFPRLGGIPVVLKRDLG